MIRGMLTTVALAIAACIAAPDLAGADAPTAPGATSVQTSVQPSIRLAQTVTGGTTATKKKTKGSKVAHPQTNWLNPQPEPPMTGKKPVQGNNWLNPQPEPPRPDTTKKLH